MEHGAFPYVTSRDTSTSALLASIGVSGHCFYVDVIGVTRTFPIRVAGNSGSFESDAEEVSWQQVSKYAGAHKLLCERTSVTNKIRRVSTFSKIGFAKAVQINRPTEIALTFADYLDWSVRNQETLSRPVEEFIDMLEGISGKRNVSLVKTGPRAIIDFELTRRSVLRKVGEY